MLRVDRLNTDGVMLLSQDRKFDHRGWFEEAFSASNFKDATELDIEFVQDSRFFSKRGAMRGPHVYKWPFMQYKLVECLMGEVLDFIVCVNPDSVHYGDHMMVYLMGGDGRQFLVPYGYAHGVLAMQDSIVQYKTNIGHLPEQQLALDWNDPELEITLPIKPMLMSPETIFLLKDLKYRE